MNTDIMEILEKSHALLSGHFLLSSGKHSPNYVQCAKIFEYPKYGEKIGEELAKLIEKYKPDVIIGPAMGGIIISYVVGKTLGVRNMFSERENGIMKLRRGFSINAGEKIAVVEDVVTTGGSSKEVIELVKELGGEVVCVGSIIDRSGGKADFGVPFEYLISLNFPIYEPDSCPLCEKNIPVVKPGSRNKNTL
ncbi:MAG: orotate phosphoribosyltransferase [Thermotogaceae bacterium]|jgi:orotate phosphoribosyltransferase|nr:orotate phosphoribosyltransferase [Thermotogaceae bacterium]MDN5337097.1 orotate phosphoribosyltransferase [Thermotogaceae bacterium]